MIGRTLLVLLVVLALSHVFAVSLDHETARGHRAHHKARLHAAKHHATVKNQLKQKAHTRMLSFLKHHSSVSSLTSSHIVAMDHAVSLIQKTFHQMKSAMKNLRHHIRAKAKHGEKQGYVYADVVDSLDGYAPVCASLPYYMVTCSNCMNYVHKCLNCVYDKPKEIPTEIPEYLSTTYLPEYPSFPAYPRHQQQQQQQQQQQEQEEEQEPQQQQEPEEEEEEEHEEHKKQQQQQQQEQQEEEEHKEGGKQQQQEQQEEEEEHKEGGKQQQQEQQEEEEEHEGKEGQQEEQQEEEEEHEEHGSLPTPSHIQTLLDSLKTGLPTLEQGLYTIQTDISKIQAHLPGGAGTQDSWPEGDTPLSDEGTLNNIADHTDVGANGPHLNHIMAIIKEIQSTLPAYQRDMKQLQRDLARCEPPLMSEPETSEPVSL